VHKFPILDLEMELFKKAIDAGAETLPPSTEISPTLEFEIEAFMPKITVGLGDPALTQIDSMTELVISWRK